MDYRDLETKRKEEYEQMLKKLDASVPENLDDVCQRAFARELKHKRVMRIVKPMASIAAVFTIFVFSVNFITPVAEACSKIPVLKELAAAVSFSNSLSAAVKNDYVQTMALSQVKDGVEADIDYVIVDKRQLNIFYRLKYTDGHKSKDGQILAASVKLDENMPPHSISWAGPDEEEDKLRKITIDFTESDVPQTVEFELEAAERDISTWERTGDKSVKFNFTLEIDPYYMAQGKNTEFDESFEISGQKFTLKNAEIYPTHLQINLESDESNTMWLKQLTFTAEIKGDNEEILGTATGVTAYGDKNTGEVLSYRKESPWFAEAETLSITIKGARLADKKKEGVELVFSGDGEDFKAEAKGLPDWITVESARMLDGSREELPDIEVRFEAEYGAEGSYATNIFETEFIDGAGKKCSLDGIGAVSSYDEKYSNILVFNDYEYDNAIVFMDFEHLWTARKTLKFEAELK